MFYVFLSIALLAFVLVIYSLLVTAKRSDAARRSHLSLCKDHLRRLNR
tara:strand:- start:2993 stop:3136 length:144 start_codon:yes stop_codon:yes gene_type:complete